MQQGNGVRRMTPLQQFMCVRIALFTPHINVPQEYCLARTHCYGRYLHSIGLWETDEEKEKWGEKVADYFQRVEKQGLIVAAVSVA